MSVWASQLRDYSHQQDKIKSSLRRGVSTQDVTRDRNSGNKNLEKCVQLLSKMLDTDAESIASTLASGSLCHKPTKATKAKVSPKKKVHRNLATKPKMTTKRSKSTKVSSGSKSPKVIQNPKKSNIKQQDASTWQQRRLIEDEIPERDTDSKCVKEQDTLHSKPFDRNYGVKFDTSQHPLPPFKPVTSFSSVPFNQRLSTSTPTMFSQTEHNISQSTVSPQATKPSTTAPWRYMPDNKQPLLNSFSSSEGYHLTVAGNNPLNSTDQCKTAAPPKPPKPIPILKEGQVDFEPNPLKAYFDESSQVTVMPSRELNQVVPPGNYSLYSASEGPSLPEYNPQSSSVPAANLNTHPTSTEKTLTDAPHTKSVIHPAVHSATTTTNQKPLSPPSRDRSTRVKQVEIRMPDLGDTTQPESDFERSVNPRDMDTSANSSRRKVQFEDESFEKEAKKAPEVDVNQKVGSQSSIGLQTSDISSSRYPQQPDTTLTENIDMPVEADIDNVPQKEEPQMKSVKQPPKKLQALHHLLKELKETTGGDGSPEVHRLVADIEATSNSMVWGKNANKQLELDLAMQPLRSENAQLRRQLRLANQQLRDKDQLVNTAQKPDPNFQVVHLEMMRHQLEKSLREERVAKDRQRERVNLVQGELSKVTEEKQRLLEVINAKDTEHMQSSDALVSEKQRLQTELDRLKQRLSETDGQMEKMRNERQLERVTLKQKDQEIAKLQELVGSLQLSMTRLLHDLQVSRPDPVLGMKHLNGGLQLSGRKLQDDIHKDSYLSAFSKPVPTKDSAESRSLSLEPTPPVSTSETSHLSDHGEVPAATDSKAPEDTTVSPTRRALNFDQRENTSLKTLAKFKTKPEDMQSTEIDKLRESLKGGDFMVSTASDTYDMDLTVSDYELPPGASPLAYKYRSKPTRDSEGPTVKELLTPIADRMQNQFHRLSTGASGSLTAGSVSTQQKEDLVAQRPSVVQEDEELSGFSSLESDQGEGDSTLIASDEKQLIEAKVQEALQEEAEMSRFSVTDYFQKYPPKDIHKSLDKLLESGTSSIEPSQEALDQTVQSTTTDTLIARHRARDKEVSLHSSSPKQQTTTTRISYSASVPSSSKSRVSLQGSAYKGTDLDTSISTIPGDDNKSVVSDSTSASTDSVSSIDDHAFTQGLAALDANIARMQQQLKVAHFAV